MTHLIAEPGLVAEAEEEAEAQPRRRGYASYVGLKVLGAMGSLIFMLVVNFFLFRVLPGDPAKSLGRSRCPSSSSRS
jgi:peptide/nickel transport system permease protein